MGSTARPARLAEKGLTSRHTLHSRPKQGKWQKAAAPATPQTYQTTCLSGVDQRHRL